jgi:formamidopyrimidine-DNA glycosylase
VPELPDLEIYRESLDSRVLHRILEDIRIVSPFLLRTVDPPAAAVRGKKVLSVRRLGKRLVFDVEDRIHLLIHLMIAGRLQWKENHPPVPKKIGLAAFDFENGTMLLVESGSKRRASLHIVRGEDGLRAFEPGGIELLDSDLGSFTEALRRENHTLKRALTTPHLISGIGNAYSDEILHRAQLSPLKKSVDLTDREIEILYHSSRELLTEWIQRLRERAGGRFPERVTAFQEGMSVHGRYGKPCPVCGTTVQRIVYADNECNYCPHCQTKGKLLADRALSRLLKADWPKKIAE